MYLHLTFETDYDYDYDLPGDKIDKAQILLHISKS